MERIEEYKALLRRLLPEKRYFHSLKVAEKAEYLAKKYNCDSGKAYLAGLLHDILKYESSEKQLKLLKDGGIILTRSQKRCPETWHAFASAVYIRDALCVDDPQIFDAVFYHTTGKENMPVLTEIIYLADMISDDRSYKEVSVLRALSEKNLDEAIKTALSMSVEFIREKNGEPCEDTLRALEYYNGYS